MIKSYLSCIFVICAPEYNVWVLIRFSLGIPGQFQQGILLVQKKNNNNNNNNYKN